MSNCQIPLALVSELDHQSIIDAHFLCLRLSLQAGVAEADAVILRMPLHSLADNDADAQDFSPRFHLIRFQLAPHPSL